MHLYGAELVEQAGTVYNYARNLQHQLYKLQKPLEQEGNVPPASAVPDLHNRMIIWGHLAFVSLAVR